MFFITWFGLVWHDLVWFACVLEIDKYGHKEVGMPRECSKRPENEVLTTVAKHGTLACYLINWYRFFSFGLGRGSKKLIAFLVVFYY